MKEMDECMLKCVGVCGWVCGWVVLVWRGARMWTYIGHVGGVGVERRANSLLPPLKLLGRVNPTLVEDGVDPKPEELGDCVG